MVTDKNVPKSSRLLEWFNPIGHTVTGWGFILNRITALALTFYLFMHLIVLGQLAQGPQAYDGFLALIHHPLFTFAEWLLVAASLIHGLNGIRIGLNSFGIGVRSQKQLLYWMMGIAGIGSAIALVAMMSIMH